MSYKMPEYFYLYLSLDNFGLKKLIALLQNQLPLTSVCRFNDPFDSKLPFDHSNNAVELDEEQRKAVDNGYFSEAGLVGVNQHSQELDWQRKYNVFCVSESWELLLMWAHYAKSHRGICLKLKYHHEKLSGACFF